MRLFYYIGLATFALFFMLTPTRAEEPRFTPQVDVSAIKTSNDMYHAKQWASSRLYERKQEVQSAYYNKRQEVMSAHYAKRLEALKKVRSSNYDAYLHWLDAREMMDFDRIHAIEKVISEFQTFRAEINELTSANDKELEVLETERDSMLSEIEAVYDAEVEMIEQAYKKIKAS